MPALTVSAPQPLKPTLANTKEAWMYAAGIPQADWSAVDAIINNESGWKPCAYYPHHNDCYAHPTAACGLVQALPCSKLGSNWYDPVHALKWANTYVRERYGGWVQAAAFKRANGWY